MLRAVQTLAFFGSLVLSGCAPWHDLFQRDRPDEELIRATISLPGPPDTDVAIVLGCPSSPNGTPHPCQECRVKSAVQSLQRGQVRALLFSGGAAHNRWVEAQVMADLALRMGAAQERLLKEPQALTTWQNLRFAKRIMQRRGFRTALIISAADHLPRARRFAEYYGIQARYQACDR